MEPLVHGQFLVVFFVTMIVLATPFQQTHSFRARTRLFSTKLTWERLPLDNSGAKGLPENSGGNSTVGAHDHQLKLLDSSMCETVVISEEELQEKWIDICIEESRPGDMSKVTLSRILPSIMRDDVIIKLENREENVLQYIDDSDIIYVTEQELLEIWESASTEPMGKSVEEFDVEQALLLLPDEDYEDLIVNSGKSSSSKSEGFQGLQFITSERSSSLPLAYLPGEVADTIEDEDDHEWVITLQELERLWGERSFLPWAPAKEFDTKAALLLLDNYDDEDEDIETLMVETEDGQMQISLKEMEYVSGKHFLPVEDSEAFWKKFSGKSNQFLREHFKRIQEDLDDQEYYRPAWKKDRSFLSPDLDTQEFMGDIMFSNTYMTQKIPANWEDPEREEMSDTYLSAGSMAWPGEPETNYNYKPPSWEVLDLPFGPDAHDQEYGAQLPVMLQEALEAHEQMVQADAEFLKMKTEEGEDSGDIDWASVDFSELDDEDLSTSTSRDNDKEAGTDKASASDSDVDDFFKSFEEKPDTSASSDKDLGLTGTEGRGGKAIDLMESALMEKALRGAQNSRLTYRAPPWATPPEWLDTVEFKDHVPYETWGQRADDGALFMEWDDTYWDEDIYTAQSMKHVLEVTDEYLFDHERQVIVNDHYIFWQRQVDAMLGDTPFTNVPYPKWLTPDIDRGIKYSDDIVEMKGKMTLHPFQEEPEIAYANHTFTHNEEFATANSVGTIREQYDWQTDQTLLPYVIEQEKLAALKPVLDYVNFAAKLLSTKDNVLVFRYKAQMRHILGMRASMLQIADKHNLGLADIRLETDRRADKFDF